MLIAHTRGDQPELSEEDAVLLLDCGNRNQVLDFKSWTGPAGSFQKQPHSGEEHRREVLTVRFPHANEHTARIGGMGRSLTTPPPTPKLPRYESGVVIDTQLYVNFSKTGNKDDDEVQGIGQMCPVGMDPAGVKDSGRWDGMSYHVV